MGAVTLALEEVFLSFSVQPSVYPAVTRVPLVPFYLEAFILEREKHKLLEHVRVDIPEV